MIVLVTGTLVPGENVFALQLVDRDKRIGEYAESLKKLMAASLWIRWYFAKTAVTNRP